MFEPVVGTAGWLHFCLCTRQFCCQHQADLHHTLTWNLVFDDEVNVQVVLKHFRRHIAWPVQEVVESMKEFRLLEHRRRRGSKEAAGRYLVGQVKVATTKYSSIVICVEDSYYRNTCH